MSVSAITDPGEKFDCVQNMSGSSLRRDKGSKEREKVGVIIDSVGII